MDPDLTSPPLRPPVITAMSFAANIFMFQPLLKEVFSIKTDADVHTFC